MQRKIRKHQKKRLLKLMCLSAAMVTANIVSPQAFATDITTDVTAQYEVSGFQKTVNLNGNVSITAADGYALCAQGTADGLTGPNHSGGETTLNVNSNGNVKIIGDIKAIGVSDGRGVVNLTLNKKDSYLAGSLILEGVTSEEFITLNLNNGSTWYVPVQAEDSYTLSHSGVNSGIHLNLDGSIVDLYHATPTTVRATAAGTRTFSLKETKETNKQSCANNATFVLSSDIAGNKADKVSLTGVSGTNTYYIQVAYDTSEGTDGTYTVQNGGLTVLTTDNAGNTVTAQSYTRTKDVAAGLLSKTLTITPEITTTNGITNLTSVKVATTESTAGPAQTMATAATSTSKGAMSSWRAENNDLLRRMGDLREDEGKAGTWGRIYGGETQINTSQTSNLNYRGVQIGYDRKIDMRGGKLFTGYALSHMNGDVSYNSGSGDTESTMLGIYGSYLGEKGHFADFIVKYGRLQNSFSTTTNSVLYEGDNSANGLNMSLEYGYHQELKNNWYLEPQVELNYGHINSSDYTMKMNGAAGAAVSNDAMDSLIGRIGVNIGKKTPTGNIYAKLSLAREFAGDVALTTKYGTYSNNSSDSMKDTWLEYGIGFNSKINKTSNLYGEISRTTGNKAVDKWKANIGYRHSF